MKAYKYTFVMFGVPKISVRVYNAEEHKKHYVVTKEKSPLSRKLYKYDIGVVSGESKDTVWLMENDFEWAKEIFNEHLDSKCTDIRNSIMRKEAEIERLQRNKQYFNKIYVAEGDV